MVGVIVHIYSQNTCHINAIILSWGEGIYINKFFSWSHLFFIYRFSERFAETLQWYSAAGQYRKKEKKKVNWRVKKEKRKKKQYREEKSLWYFIFFSFFSPYTPEPFKCKLFEMKILHKRCFFFGKINKNKTKKQITLNNN